MDDGIWNHRLTSWDIRPVSPNAVAEGIRVESHDVTIYRGPSRVLEIGCSDGSWCFNFKKEQPTWIVEGVDDTDQ
jgi:tRNA G46 methylase TrmB